MTDTAARMTAESFLTRLADRGVEYVLANAGTDFAPIIEALSRNPGSNRKYPRVITVPHENVAVSMAHGYYRVSGKPAVVMVHVTVGTANAMCALMNAARDNCPIILGAGRTPHHRDRARGLAQPLDPLGPGNVRPGQPRPRIRKMGLRAARRPAGELGGRPRPRHRHVGAARAGLSHAAARGAGRSRRGAAPRHRAAARRQRAGAVARRDRGSSSLDGEGGIPAASSPRRPGARPRRWRDCRRSPRNSPCRWCSRRRATSACRPAIPCASASMPARISARPTWSRCSTARCRGSRACMRSTRTPRSSASVPIRCSRAIRSANSRPTSWSPANPPRRSPCCAKRSATP